MRVFRWDLRPLSENTWQRWHYRERMDYHQTVFEELRLRYPHAAPITDLPVGVVAIGYMRGPWMDVSNLQVKPHIDCLQDIGVLPEDDLTVITWHLSHIVKSKRDETRVYIVPGHQFGAISELLQIPLAIRSAT